MQGAYRPSGSARGCATTPACLWRVGESRRVVFAADRERCTTLPRSRGAPTTPLPAAPSRFVRRDLGQDLTARQRQRVLARREQVSAMESLTTDLRDLRCDIVAPIDAWAQGKSVSALLATLHEAFPERCGPGSVAHFAAAPLAALPLTLAAGRRDFGAAESGTGTRRAVLRAIRAAPRWRSPWQ